MVAAEDQANDLRQELGREQVDDVLAAFWQWLRIQEARWGDNPRSKEFHASPSIAAGAPLLDENLNRAAAIRRRSIRRRIVRTALMGLIVGAVAGAAYGWQSSDDQTRDAVRRLVQQLGGLSSILGNPPAGAESAADPAVQTADAKPMREAALQPTADAQPAAAVPPELQHRIETMGSDLALVQRTLEKLIARQEQMAQDIATLQSAQKSVAQKLSPPPQPAALNAAPHRPATKPARTPAPLAPAALVPVPQPAR